jgi:hypothetical protein
MMHPTEGEMRAYQDGELPEPQRAEVRSHLVECARCRQQAGEMAARSERVHCQLSILSPVQEVLPAHAARARLRLKTAQKERTMLHRLFRARYRPLWAAAVSVAVLAVSLSFPQVRAAAGRLLQLFRVERITPVQVGLGIDEVPGEVEGYLAKLEALLGSQIEFDGLLEPVQVPDVEQAGALVGFPVRLPAALEGAPRLTCQQARTVRLTIERNRWQALLNEMGYGDFVLPQSVDGGTVTIQIPDMVAAMYGGFAAGETPRDSDGIVLIQSRNPSIEVPPELDINRMGEIFLEALDVPSAEAAELAGRVDWLTTLVIPVPQGAEYRVIPGVDGVSGILFDDPSAKARSRYTLVWLKDGILYGLIGASDADEATAVANSLP